MPKILNKLEAMSGAQSSALFVRGNVLASTFSKEKRLFARVALQTFTHIFRHTEQVNPKYDEAHLQLDDDYFICVRLEPQAFYLCMTSQKSDIHKLQKAIHSTRPVMAKLLAKARTDAPET